jgi:hypothetical protein
MMDKLYDEFWAGYKSPATYEAFESGIEAAIEKISEHLADQPAEYDQAKSVYDWQAEIKKWLNITD